MNQHCNSFDYCSIYFVTINFVTLHSLFVLSANAYNLDFDIDIDTDIAIAIIIDIDNNISIVQLTAEEDDKARLSAKKYFFVVNDDEVIDPTNKAGLLDLEISFLAGLVKVDTMLGRVNEPPRDSTVNVFTRLNGPDATVVADREIFADGKYLQLSHSLAPPCTTITFQLYHLPIFLLDMYF